MHDAHVRFWAVGARKVPVLGNEQRFASAIVGQFGAALPRRLVKARQSRQGMSKPVMVWLDKLESLDNPVRDEPQAGAAEGPPG